MKPLALAALLALAATPALGQVVCNKRDEALKQLAENWRERPVAMALKSDGSVFEIAASPDGATWTALLTYPNGITCVLANGEDFELVAPVEPGEPS